MSEQREPKVPASARGLFHATGFDFLPVAVRQEDGTIVKVAARLRAENDFEPTPPEPTDALVAAEGAIIRRFPLVWEMACGDGRMMRDLARHGFDVVGSDLVDRGCGATIRSFYDFGAAPSKCGITNPPFDQVNWQHGRARWLTHALDVLDLDYLALLLPWSWPGAAGLAGIWARRPPSRVYLMRWRIDFTGMGANPSNHAWWIWDKTWTGETVLRMLDRVDPAQTSLFGGLE